jgi:hypothetical protein
MDKLERFNDKQFGNTTVFIHSHFKQVYNISFPKQVLISIGILVGFSDKTQYKYFFRTIPTKVTLADVMLDFTVSQRCSQIGIIYSNDPLGQQCK